MAAKRYNYSYTNPVTFIRGGLTIGVPSVPQSQIEIASKRMADFKRRMDALPRVPPGAAGSDAP